MSTREEILKAADRLFGEVGFDAASTREIAEISGVNKALIHYHFKNKEALLGCVMEQYYERFGKIMAEALGKEGGMREKMKHLIDAYMDFLSNNLNFSRIVQREGAGGKHMDRIQGSLSPMFENAVKMIREAYPGTHEGDMAAHHLLISFYGMIVSYFTYSGLLERLLGRDPLSKEELEQRKRHLYRMLDMVLDMVEKEVG